MEILNFDDIIYQKLVILELFLNILWRIMEVWIRGKDKEKY